MNCQEPENILGNCAQRTGELISWKSGSTTDAPYRLGRRGVENLAFEKLRAVARIEHRVLVFVDQGRPQQRGKSPVRSASVGRVAMEEAP